MKYSNYTKGSLSGSYRVTGKEQATINFLRYRKKMSITYIADLLRRSTATVHRILNIGKETGTKAGYIDNRGQTRVEYQNRKMVYNTHKPEMQLRIKLFLKGVAESLLEAFGSKAIEKYLRRIFGETQIWMLSENTEEASKGEPP